MAKKYYQEDNLDFLQPDNKITATEQQVFERPKPRRQKSRKKGLILFMSIIAFVLSSFLYVQASASPLSQGLKTFPWINSLKQLINPDDQVLLGEENDAINVLLIGMGGAGHDGAYLADTIMLMRFKPSTKQVALVSFPRDLAVQVPDHGWRKINNANAYGGPELMIDVLSKVIGDSIPYYVMVDFNGFESIIDDLGGVDVYVENSFTDYEYPADNYLYQTVSFTKGQQHMDGAEALIFARSRHGNNGEGSDFARSARQQKILFAVKDKIISVNTLLNPTKLLTLYNNLVKYIETNIEPPTVVRMAQLAQGTRQSSISSTVIIDGPNGLLDSTIGEDGAYLLIPKEGFGNFSTIQNLITNIFNRTEQVPLPTTDAQPTPAKTIVETTPTKPSAIILNGTTIPGYAAAVASELQNGDFKIVATANHLDQTQLETTVYQLSKPTSETTDFIKDVLEFNQADKIPDELQTYLNTLASPAELTDLQFLIILGADNKDVLQ